MAGLSPLPAEPSEQLRLPSNFDLFSAVADLRWRLLVNSLRTVRGRLELLSRFFVAFTAGMVAIGGAAFLAPVSYFAIQNRRPEYISLALWFIFTFWQLFPLMGSLASVPFEFGTLLRFPMSFSTFWWLAFAYGLVDPICVVSLFWLLAILAGVGIASLSLLPGAALILTVFALVNLFLQRALHLWLERWLARRKAREILGVVFLFFIIGMQFLGPLVARVQRRPQAAVNSLNVVSRIATVLPPGLAGFSMQEFDRGDSLQALAACAALGAYAAIFAALFNSRLHAQFVGENLSEAAAPVEIRAPGELRQSWNLRGLSGPVAAVFEKEVRYLLRSAPVIFMLVMPVVVLAIFRINPARSGARSALFATAADWAFPVGAAYALLMLSNMVYNAFGADGSGLQFFFIAPVPLRDVLLAKNMGHLAVMVVDTVLVLIASSLLFRPPRGDVVFVTLAALLFAFPLNLAAGNLMSVYSPKRYDLATFGRQRANTGTAIVAMIVQAFELGVCFLVIFACYRAGQVWFAGIIFVLLAAVAFAVYWAILNKSAQAALDRREVLVAEITRVSSDATADGRIS